MLCSVPEEEGKGTSSPGHKQEDDEEFQGPRQRNNKVRHWAAQAFSALLPCRYLPLTLPRTRGSVHSGTGAMTWVRHCFTGPALRAGWAVSGTL